MNPIKKEDLPPGLLHGAFDRAHVVFWNDMHFQQFSNETSVIGTYALRACSVVLVASPVGAVLAHIAPLGDEYVRRMMDRFNSLYQPRAVSHFGAERHPWVVIGLMHTGDGDAYTEALPDMNLIINERLVAMGLQPSSSDYKFKVRLAQDSPQFPGKGTVLVDAKNGLLKIYVEDQLVHSS